MCKDSSAQQMRMPQSVFTSRFKMHALLHVNRNTREYSDMGLQVPTDTLLQLLRET